MYGYFTDLRVRRHRTPNSILNIFTWAITNVGHIIFIECMLILPFSRVASSFLCCVFSHKHPSQHIFDSHTGTIEWCGNLALIWEIYTSIYTILKQLEKLVSTVVQREIIQIGLKAFKKFWEFEHLQYVYFFLKKHPFFKWNVRTDCHFHNHWKSSSQKNMGIKRLNTGTLWFGF